MEAVARVCRLCAESGLHAARGWRCACPVTCYRECQGEQTLALRGSDREPRAHTDGGVPFARAPSRAGLGRPSLPVCTQIGSIWDGFRQSFDFVSGANDIVVIRHSNGLTLSSQFSVQTNASTVNRHYLGKEVEGLGFRV